MKKKTILTIILVIILVLGISGYFGVKKAIQIGKEKGGEFLNELTSKENGQPAGEEEQSGETSSGTKNNPIMDKNIEDVSSKEMIEYCQQQVNEMVIETPIYLKDSCFYQIAVHFRNPELCNNIDIADTKEKCLESVGDFSKEWDAMQGKIGKMNEALYVEIGVEANCAVFAGASDFEAYQKWLDEWPENLNNKFGVTMEEYKLYSKVIKDDGLSAMNLDMRVLDQVHETCPD